MSKLRTIAALAAVATFAGSAGTAVAQTGDTTVTVGPTTTLTAGQDSPFDAPGVRAIRQGKEIPSGYRLIGRTVSGSTGGVGAAIRFTCPDGKRLRTFGVTGRAGFSMTRDYVGHRSTVVTSFARQGASGTVYAVCR